MRSFLHLALVALPLFTTVAVAEEPNSIYANAHEAFQDLLNALPDESLQAALTSLTKFKAGVFESHRRGVERVHNDNPPLATRLIVEAVRDLTRRQQPANGTSADPSSDSQTVNTPQSSQPPPGESSQPPPPSTNNQPQTSSPPPATSNPPPQTSSSPPQTSNSPPQTSDSNPPESSNPPPQTSNPPATSDPAPPTSRPVLVPIVATVTNKEGRTVVSTTSVFSEVTASLQVTVTRTNAAGATVTTAEFKPAVIKTVTDAQGRAETVTSTANYAPTKGEVITSTNEQGSTFLTTYTPDGGRVSTLKLITTTDAEGRPSTITSYSYVDPTAEGGDGNGGGQADPTRTGAPGLQTGAANRALGMQYAMAGGALGAWAMFF
jgi:hypothetical protein